MPKLTTVPATFEKVGRFFNAPTVAEGVDEHGWLVRVYDWSTLTSAARIKFVRVFNDNGGEKGITLVVGDASERDTEFYEMLAPFSLDIDIGRLRILQEYSGPVPKSAADRKRLGEYIASRLHTVICPATVRVSTMFYTRKDA